jgi:hypothetical protein
MDRLLCADRVLILKVAKEQDILKVAKEQDPYRKKAKEQDIRCRNFQRYVTRKSYCK